MQPQDVTVIVNPHGAGLIASTWELSPKPSGGWHQFFWTGIVEDHPGYALCSQDTHAAASFPSLEELQEALATLRQPHVIATAFQPGLW